MRKFKPGIFIFIIILLFQSPAFSETDPIDTIKANVKKMVEAQQKEAPSITVSELNTLMEKQDFYFEILDVRTLEEFSAGHIAGAVHSDRNKLEWVTPKKIKDPDVPIYVYCESGSRGAISTIKLIEMGYKNVTNITGGMKAWANAGYPVYNEMGEFTFTKDGFGKRPE